MKYLLSLLTLLLLLTTNIVGAEDNDFWDPFDLNPVIDSKDDQKKSAETLIKEASILIYDQPLTARSKLVLALNKSPRSIIALSMLGNYYLTTVGHYRLALKYLKKSEQILFEDYGSPPYQDFQAQILHAEILRQLATVRQSLDLYQQALNNLNEYEAYGYSDPYLEATRAWIYFKLNQPEKGIEEAKNGIRKGSAISNNLNVLGILYSVTGEKEKGIETLQKAYDFEKSMGTYGRSATPLNNMGEVYRELFQEDSAISSWQNSIRQPDGCEHILPSLNLAIINIEGLQLQLAERSLENFQSCFAQYPLRNNEEHQSLLELIMGRIKYYSGDPIGANLHYLKAIEHQQWFGSIGANIEDLQSAIYTDLAKNLVATNNHLRVTITSGLLEKLNIWKEIIKNKIRASWYNRKAKLLLLSKLENFEDLDIRHTDSLLDYPSLGFFFQNLPTSTAERLIKKQSQIDHRKHAKFYYQSYLAFNYANKGPKAEAKKILLEIINEPLVEFDQALKAQALAELIRLIPKQEQQLLIEKLFRIHPAGIINNHLSLAVQGSKLPPEIQKLLRQTNFDLTSGGTSKFQLTYSKNEKVEFLTLLGPNNFRRTVQGKDRISLINNLTKEIFIQHE